MSYLFLNLTYTAAYFVNGLTLNLAFGEFTSAQKKNFTGRVKTYESTPSLNLETVGSTSLSKRAIKVHIKVINAEFEPGSVGVVSRRLSSQPSTLSSPLVFYEFYGMRSTQKYRVP